ncbi:aldolase catalytic domain-containing protein [Acetatifactor aquisgranensis]|uniref:aldolase catalytic domain-containing protein n=1 Tax=Acetatifactor aquisgranensis TaxID=2941233 RepID=UPI00203EA783|nr:aldolase catalytic domain-containing protein [Acetatifactor aquisgranensis]MCI8542386.1 nucleoid-structuring protein H-NS [Lachnospiraceae bacterium]
MKEISNLIAYRPDVKVVDATLRDGGLVNNFYFTDEFVKALYLANLRAGVDYMEFGYKASKEMFDEDKFGKWKFSKDEDIRKIVGENATDLKIAVMADVGRCEKTDIIDRTDSPIDMIRVAAYVNAIPGAVDLIEDASKKGYEVSCNIMAISHSLEGELRAALDILGQTPVDVLYIVDSYGAMYPEQIARFADMYLEFATKYGKKVGIHAHNNQQLAFANTIEAVGDGVDWLDATYASMGRGAGNCAMELLLGFLRNPKYNVYPAIRFVDKYMNQLKNEGVVWGYDLQYLMTGLLNQHPRAAIQFTNEKRTDYTEFYKEMVAQD